MISYRKFNIVKLLPSSRMLKTFVCTSLGLRRCAYGCLFFRSVWIEKLFFKIRDYFMDFFGIADNYFVLCI